jgi:N-acylglucosamine-6-phosphate 2-epimerase
MNGRFGLLLTARFAGLHRTLERGLERPASGTIYGTPRTLAETITALRNSGPTIVMADCGSLDDALAARDGGADIIGTTLAGYTADRPASDGPDLELLTTKLVARLPDAPIVAEGRIYTPAQARAAIDAGAYAVVVGTAITHPTTITGWFRQTLATR